MSKVDQGINYMADFPQPYTKKEKARRFLWNIVHTLLVRPCPRGKFFSVWRRFIYRSFGAKMADTASVHASAKVFMPWNLEMAPYSVIGDNAEIYNPTLVKLGRNCVVSQHAYLCATGHNIYSTKHEQVDKPIILEDRSWVATSAFIGMGVTIGEGAVVGMGSVVTKDVPAGAVIGGNPARIIKYRNMEVYYKLKAENKIQKV